MAGTMVPTAATQDAGGDVAHGLPIERRETGWRRFLVSWQLGALLAAGCIVGLIAIFSTHPFSSPSVSERVSEVVGQPASCSAVGAADVAGEHSTIYKCTVGSERSHVAQCFTIGNGEVRQVGGARKLGC
jgi:hypothetical protein